MDATTTQHGVTAHDRAELERRLRWRALDRELERCSETEVGALALAAAVQAGTLPADLRLEAGDFRDPRHARVFAAMRQLADAAAPITVDALVELLDADGPLEAVGGWRLLLEHAVYQESTAAMLNHHARHVRRLAARRLLKRMLRRVLDDHDTADDRRAMVQILAELSMSAGGR